MAVCIEKYANGSDRMLVDASEKQLLLVIHFLAVIWYMFVTKWHGMNIQSQYEIGSLPLYPGWVCGPLQTKTIDSFYHYMKRIKQYYWYCSILPLLDILLNIQMTQISLFKLWRLFLSISTWLQNLLVDDLFLFRRR